MSINKDRLSEWFYSQLKDPEREVINSSPAWLSYFRCFTYWVLSENKNPERALEQLQSSLRKARIPPINLTGSLWKHLNVIQRNKIMENIDLQNCLDCLTKLIENKVLDEEKALQQLLTLV